MPRLEYQVDDDSDDNTCLEDPANALQVNLDALRLVPCATTNDKYVREDSYYLVPPTDSDTSAVRTSESVSHC